MYYDQQARLRSMAASWTDVVEPDTFAEVAAGRSWFRTDDLAALVEVMASFERSRRRGKSGGVK